LMVEDRSSYKLSFDVPQQDLQTMREGLDLRFTVDGRENQAKLTHLYPSLDTDRMMRAECVLQPGQARGVLCGSYVPVSVVVRQIKDAVLIPAGCLVESPAGEPHVFVVRDKKLAHPAVKVLGRSGDRVAVDGIEAGEQVVTSTFLGWSNLAGGMKVAPTP